MKAFNYFKKMMAIYERLSDEESKRVFEARTAYMFDGSRDNYIEAMGEIYHDWQILEIREKLKDNQEIIVFGCGHDGKQAYKLLTSGGGGRNSILLR